MKNKPNNDLCGDKKITSCRAIAPTLIVLAVFSANGMKNEAQITVIHLCYVKGMFEFEIMIPQQ